MFDIAPTELLLCAIVALLVIGPKDLPKAMRVVGHWVGRARGMARHFRSGFDAMVREAELEEMEKKWKAENERIMREYPSAPPANDDPAAADDAGSVTSAASTTPTEYPGEGRGPAPQQATLDPGLRRGTGVEEQAASTDSEPQLDLGLGTPDEGDKRA